MRFRNVLPIKIRKISVSSKVPRIVTVKAWPGDMPRLINQDRGMSNTTANQAAIKIGFKIDAVTYIAATMAIQPRTITMKRAT